MNSCNSLSGCRAVFFAAAATIALLSMSRTAAAQDDWHNQQLGDLFPNPAFEELREALLETAEVRDNTERVLKKYKCLPEEGIQTLKRSLYAATQRLRNAFKNLPGDDDDTRLQAARRETASIRLTVKLPRLQEELNRFPRCKPPSAADRDYDRSIFRALRTGGRLPEPRSEDERPKIASLIVEPKISIGLVATSGSPSYDSTGGQAPFNGDWSHSTGQFCGGATFYPGFGIGPARVGLDVNACSGSNTFGSGDTTLFAIMRHGPGDVVLRSSTNVIIDTLVKAEIPLGNPEVEYDSLSRRFFVSVGVGPTFREQNLNLTSDQSFFGGGVPSIRETTWQTGFAVSAGLSTFVCPTCIAGNPLKVGIEGRARFFPSQSNSLHSIAFAFEERGSTGSTTDYSAQVTFSVPIAYGGDPIADRFGKR
jgi:hypothetical protein